MIDGMNGFYPHPQSEHEQLAHEPKIRKPIKHKQESLSLTYWTLALSLAQINLIGLNHVETFGCGAIAHT
jgi:hypothetical protein